MIKPAPERVFYGQKLLPFLLRMGDGFSMVDGSCGSSSEDGAVIIGPTPHVNSYAEHRYWHIGMNHGAFFYRPLNQ